MTDGISSAEMKGLFLDRPMWISTDGPPVSARLTKDDLPTPYSQVHHPLKKVDNREMTSTLPCRPTSLRDASGFSLSSIQITHTSSTPAECATASVERTIRDLAKTPSDVPRNIGCPGQDGINSLPRTDMTSLDFNYEPIHFHERLFHGDSSV